jgi:hypothetical protein
LPSSRPSRCSARRTPARRVAVQSPSSGPTTASGRRRHGWHRAGAPRDFGTDVALGDGGSVALVGASVDGRRTDETGAAFVYVDGESDGTVTASGLTGPAPGNRRRAGVPGRPLPVHRRRRPAHARPAQRRH